MGAIVKIQLKRLEKLLADRKITLDFDTDALNWLADKGYDPAYGARPLKRVIQRFVQDPVAEKILQGDIRDGQRVKVVQTSDRLNFIAGDSRAVKDRAA
jgi:ATP-dependent Clp protease ATP-binding subunit ClpB